MLRVIAFLLLALNFTALLYAQPSMLPLTGKGDCEKGKGYAINSIDDLKTKYISDLECVFAAGQAPDEIGLGYYYGTVLLGENSLMVQPFAMPFYQGDYVVRTTCAKKVVHFGLLKVAGIQVGAAPWTLAPFQEALAPGEAYIDPHVGNIVMDFRQNVHDICPVEDEIAMRNTLGFLPFKTPPAPVNCFVDLARVVGVDPVDGGTILLAKGMNNNPATGWQTSLFYALKNFDPATKRDFKSGTELRVPSSFNYIHNGLVDTFSQFGASGGIPFLLNTKQLISAALTSNPLVAALSLIHPTGIGAHTFIPDAIMPAMVPEQYYIDEYMKRASQPEAVESEEIVPESISKLLRVEGSSDSVKESTDSSSDYKSGVKLIQSLNAIQALVDQSNAAGSSVTSEGHESPADVPSGTVGALKLLRSLQFLQAIIENDNNPAA